MPTAGKKGAAKAETTGRSKRQSKQDTTAAEKPATSNAAEIHVKIGAAGDRVRQLKANKAAKVFHTLIILQGVARLQ